MINFLNKACDILGIDRKIHSKEVVLDKALHKGKITEEECFRKYFGVPISEDDMKKIIELWTTNWKPREDMMNLVKRLKLNYRLAVISNSDPINSDNCLKKGYYEPFEELILSHELGLIKPGRRIYEVAIKRMNTRPEECLFIDDQEDCLVPARRMGMKTILFKNIRQLRAELRSLGIRF